MRFEHLKFADQTYFEHFKDSFYYGILALKASFYFFAHAVYPDWYTTSGSAEIYNLYFSIALKYQELDKKKSL